MTVIIDYGVGNLFSLSCSLEYIGEKAVVSDSPEIIGKSDRIILPGVGAFRDAAEKLRLSGLAETVRSEALKGKPLLGICLGMQVLFDRSFEYGDYAGLGLIKGNVVPIAPVIPEGYKIPHMGWNSLRFPDGKSKSPIFKYTSEGEYMYFVHSYHASGCDASITAFADYGAPLTAAVQNGSIFGTQFHPEKSGNAGLGILRAFCEL